MPYAECNVNLRVPKITSAAMKAVRKAVLAVLARQRLVEAGPDEDATRTFMVLPDEGWIVVLGEDCGDLNTLEEIALQASEQLKCDGVVSLVEDKSVRGLWLYRSGRLAGAIEHWPEPPAARNDRVGSVNDWRALTGECPESEVGAWLANPSKASLEGLFEAMGLPEPGLAIEDIDEEEFPQVICVRARHKGATKVTETIPTTKPAEVPEPRVPAFICGTSAEAIRKTRAVVKEAVAAGDLRAALQGVEWIPVDRAPGKLVFSSRVSNLLEPNTYFSHVWDALKEASQKGIKGCGPDRDRAWSHRLKQLLVQGLHEFWFCGVVLAHSGALLPVYEPCAEENRHLPLAILKGLIMWWDDFVHVDHRVVPQVPLFPSWVSWGRLFPGLCLWAGMDAGTHQRLVASKQASDAKKIIDVFLRPIQKM